jgi:hypothetical protein
VHEIHQALDQFLTDDTEGAIEALTLSVEELRWDDHLKAPSRLPPAVSSH